MSCLLYFIRRAAINELASIYQLGGRRQPLPGTRVACEGMLTQRHAILLCMRVAMLLQDAGPRTSDASLAERCRRARKRLLVCKTLRYTRDSDFLYCAVDAISLSQSVPRIIAVSVRQRKVHCYRCAQARGCTCTIMLNVLHMRMQPAC